MFSFTLTNFSLHPGPALEQQRPLFLLALVKKLLLTNGVLHTTLKLQCSLDCNLEMAS
jgi:hypothetical protein